MKFPKAALESTNIQHSSLGERTYEEIKALILSGEIPAGERLRYRDMVELFGVSQTPVKEAFTRLETEGYVVTIKRKGTFVREFSAKEIREIFEVREMLEALAVRLICQKSATMSFAALNEVNGRFRDAIRRKKVDACTEADLSFHELLIEMSGNGKLVEIMRKSNLHLLTIVQNSPNYLDIADEYCKMHAEILKALENGDEQSAERLMRNHINYGKSQVLAAMSASAGKAPSNGPGSSLGARRVGLEALDGPRQAP